jgi:tetraether lipid synthase
LLDDKALFNRILAQTAQLQFDRQRRSAAVRTFVRGIRKNPRLTLRAALWLIRKLWRAKADLFRARGRVDKLSFFIHNFMDACSLESDRIDACIFSAATGEGPISMCLHNAKRDAFVLHRVRLNGAGDRFWDPLSGQITPEPIRIHPAIDLGHKLAKGRLKRALAGAGPAKR